MMERRIMMIFFRATLSFFAAIALALLVVLPRSATAQMGVVLVSEAKEKGNPLILNANSSSVESVKSASNPTDMVVFSVSGEDCSEILAIGTLGMLMTISDTEVSAAPLNTSPGAKIVFSLDADASGKSVCLKNASFSKKEYMIDENGLVQLTPPPTQKKEKKP